jgi:hypothetical protein
MIIPLIAHMELMQTNALFHGQMKGFFIGVERQSKLDLIAPWEEPETEKQEPVKTKFSILDVFDAVAEKLEPETTKEPEPQVTKADIALLAKSILMTMGLTLKMNGHVIGEKAKKEVCLTPEEITKLNQMAGIK